MKLKKEKEGLQMFCARKGEELRTWMEHPFFNPEDNGRLWATDSHILIIVDKNLVTGDYPEKAIKKPLSFCEVLDATSYEGSLIKFDDIYSKMQPYLTEQEMQIIGEESVTCPDCNGFGVVNWEYEDTGGDLHHEDFTCPVCEGSGKVLRQIEEPTGWMMPARNTIIDIDDIFVSSKEFMRAVNALIKMEFRSMRLTLIKRGILRFQVTKGVTVLMNARFKEDEISIKI